MKSTLVISLLSIVIILFSGCIEEFDIQTERNEGVLIINGRVTNDIGPHKVTITRTAKKNRISIPEGGANVSLLDNQDNVYEFFQEIPGTYTLPEGYASIFPGVSYQIRVELNGKVYESAMTVINDLLAEDSIGYRFEDEVTINELGNELSTRWYNVYLKSRTSFFDQKQYFKWEASEVYTIPGTFPIDPPCFLANRLDPQRVIIGESIQGNELILDDVLIARRRLNDAFSVKHYTLVSQLSISEDEYQYWRKVQISIDQVGSIFDVPPARILGNITNIDDPDEIVYGYFSVAAEKTVRYFINSEDVPGEIPSLCSRFPFNIRPSYCFCVGGIARPSYF